MEDETELALFGDEDYVTMMGVIQFREGWENEIQSKFSNDIFGIQFAEVPEKEYSIMFEVIAKSPNTTQEELYNHIALIENDLNGDSINRDQSVITVPNKDEKGCWVSGPLTFKAGTV